MDSELESTIEQVRHLHDELEKLKVEFVLLEMRINSEHPPRRKVNWFVIGVALYGGVLALALARSHQGGLTMSWLVAFCFWCACMIAVFVAKQLDG